MSNDRLPPLKREDYASPAAFDNAANMAGSLFGPPEKSPFVYKRASDGALVGPFPFVLAAPEAGEYVMGVYQKIAGIPGLPADAKEVAILAVGAKFKADYELYAHTNVAIKKVGMDRKVVEAVARGEKPQGMNEGCNVAFDAASHLAGTPGPLPKDLWDRCINCFGKQGTAALVHYVGAYAYTCIMLNAMDCPVPEDS
jgi:hypothetical protein